MTKNNKGGKMKKKEKKELDQSIGYLVKEGYLDEDRARKMTYKEKQEYLDWSEAKAEAYYDSQREGEK